MRIELPHAFAKFVLELARIGLCAQIDVHEAEMGVFEVWKVGLRRRRLTQISVFFVRDQPNYFNVLRVDRLHVVHQPETLPDWISTREVFPGKTLIDDSVGVMTPVAWPKVLRGEVTPRDDGNTERGKVAGADMVE